MEHIKQLSGFKESTQLIMHHIKNNSKIFVYGDYDVDGVSFAQSFRVFFKSIGFENYTIFKYKNKTHQIDTSILQQGSTFNPDLIIIGDAGSSCINTLISLKSICSDIVLIDHHETAYALKDFQDLGITILNCTLGVKLKDRVKTSAAALGTAVILELSSNWNSLDLGYLSVWGLISLYSDSIDTNGDYARYLYDLVESRYSTPFEVELFMETEELRRKFISFDLVPKLNSAFRNNRLDLINDYFSDDNTSHYEHLLEFRDLHTYSREVSEEISNSSIVEEYSNLAVCYIKSNEFSKEHLASYKGLVCSNLSSKIGKPVISILDTGYGILGSVRDTKGRDLKRVFSPYMYTGGHPPAFGHSMTYSEYIRFPKFISKINDRISTMESLDLKNYIVSKAKDKFTYTELCSIAKENEFHSLTNPERYISIWVDLHSYQFYESKFTQGDFYTLYLSRPNKVYLGSIPKIPQNEFVISKVYFSQYGPKLNFIDHKEVSNYEVTYVGNK